MGYELGTALEVLLLSVDYGLMLFTSVMQAE
jgi:hypothetical protein